MINYRCYKVEDLLNLLGNNFYIIDQNVQEFDCDWVCGESTSEEVNKFYITNKNDIKSIKEWYGLWSEIAVYLNDGTKLKLHSDNINSDDKNLIRISENGFLSPSFRLQESYILANKELDKWILYNLNDNKTQDFLDKISVYFTLYPTYIYKNIYEPIIENEKICGSYGYEMKLSEDKIDKALSDIKDVEMRLKIEKVLKSFEKIYE